MKERIAAQIERNKEDVTITFFIDGKYFAFRTTKQGLAQLLHEEGTLIGRIEFD